MAVSIKCPECSAVLKSPTAIPVGRQVKCPKCTKTFTMSAELQETGVTATPPAPPPVKPSAPPRPKTPEPALEATTEYEAVGDDYEAVTDDYEAVEDEEPAAKPAAKKKAAPPAEEEPAEEARPKKKKKARAEEEEEEPEEPADDEQDERPAKKKKGSRHPVALVYSLMVLGFGLVMLSFAGTLYYILADIKTESNDLLVYLPSNCNVIFGVNFESFWKTKLGEQARQAATAQANVDLQASGLKTEEFMHEMVVGTYANPRTGMNNPKVVAVLKTKVAFDKAKMAATFKGTTKKSVDGMDYWAKGGESFFMPSTQIVVFARGMSENELGDLMRSTTSSVSPELRGLVSQVNRNSLWMAMSWDDTVRQQIASGANQAPPALQKLARSVAAGTGMTLTLNIDSSVKIGVGVAVGGNAGQVTEDAKAAWESVSGFVGAMLLGQAGEVKDVLTELVKNIKFTNEGNVARVTTEVKLDLLEKMAPQLGPGLLK